MIAGGVDRLKIDFFFEFIIFFQFFSIFFPRAMSDPSFARIELEKALTGIGWSSIYILHKQQRLGAKIYRKLIKNEPFQCILNFFNLQ